MNNKISMDKRYKTRDGRDGRDVRVLCVDRLHCKFPIIALITNSDGVEEYTTFADTGGFHDNGRDSCSDLIEQPEEHTIDVWVALYKREGKYKDSVEIFHSSNEQDVKDYAYHRGFGIKAMKKFTLTLKEGEME